eukprot:TRINITY_DN21121_c0_g2_i1.p1 TRINITY_DN21121_c0_g2~~TRINITY_DN21121_c0_g2_i1.p1  ORF type:complete len:267 (-),score=60.99 TRINITY_DN21121_c0_g2_i1:11-739(-)
MKQVQTATAQHEEKLGSAIRRYKSELAARRKAFDQLQELRGNIRVYCRARPVIKLDTQTETSITFPEDENMVTVEVKGKKYEFEFDKVYQPKHDQKEIFEDVKPLITSVMDGYNTCIFAFGQTGSGKTYTMMGGNEEGTYGVNVRALKELFRIKKLRQSDWEYTIHVSMLEIYNEKIRDLLAGSQEELKLRQGAGTNGNYIENLKTMAVEQDEDVLNIIQTGKIGRAVQQECRDRSRMPSSA